MYYNILNTLIINNYIDNYYLHDYQSKINRLNLNLVINYLIYF